MKPPSTCAPTDAPAAFRTALIRWFQEHAVSYPWRETELPYEILVSEVMLQQTTVQSVIENKRFQKFLLEFPNPQALAQATEEEILRAWEGLGYYNRVRNLQKTARAVCEEFGGDFPRDLDGLKALPGIGPYTAAAVASFSYNLPAPLVDANVFRVFSRLFNDETPIDSPAGIKKAWGRAETLVSPDNARAYNAALMELGQRLCKNKETLCLECPVSQYCLSGDPLSLPVKKSKKKAEEVTEHALWHLRPNGNLLLQKGVGSRRKGMWTLPLVTPEEVSALPLIHVSKYAITKYKVTLKVYAAEECAEIPGEWIPLKDLLTLPMPSPIRRVVDALLLS